MGRFRDWRRRRRGVRSLYWKCVRVVTLAGLILILGDLTYPTWSEFLTSDSSGPPFRAGYDQIGEVALQNQVNILGIEIQVSANSTEITKSSTPKFDARMYIDE